MVKGMILGDSHAFHLKDFDEIDCDSQAFIAGSAKGLMNPNSLSGYGAHISANWNALVDGKKVVIFKFGQVDVEFLYHLRNVQVAIDFEAYVINVVKAYIQYILTLNHSDKIICIMSVFPPCFNDTFFKTFIKFLNDERKWNIDTALIDNYKAPSLEERTAMHAKMNNVLQVEAKKHNFVYIDCFTPLLSNSGATVNPAFVSHAMNDCHLSNFSTPLVPEAKSAIQTAIKRVFNAIEKDFDFF
mgnify:CR=1 FL=1